MTATEQLRVKVQAWADKSHRSPTQKWPAWKIQPAEVLALLDVAEAAQGVIHDASLSDNYVSHASTRKLSDALKKLPQVYANEGEK